MNHLIKVMLIDDDPGIVRRHRDDIEHARKVSADAREPTRRDPCRIGDLEMLFDRYEVRLRGNVVPLTAKEFEILALLAESPGEVFTRRRIYELSLIHI